MVEFEVLGRAAGAEVRGCSLNAENILGGMSATIETIREAVSRTREARERVQQHRSTDAVIGVLAQTAKNWLDPNSPWRKRAVESAPKHMGFSEAMVQEAIDLTFGAINYESLGELLDRELGNRRVLDEFCLRGRVQSRAIAPRLLVHFLAGNVPMPGIVSICCGLLLRTANLVKSVVARPGVPFPVHRVGARGGRGTGRLRGVGRVVAR